MFALVNEHGIVTCVNETGFENAVLKSGEVVIKRSSVTIGNFFDGSDIHDSKPKSNDELFTEEMDALNSNYAINVKLAVDKVSAALAWDGAEETVKVTNARAELAQLRSNYETDSTSIITKYYGE